MIYNKTVNDTRENIIGNYMETLLEVISGHTSRSTKQVVKKMLLLKVIRSFDTGYRQYLWMNKRPSRHKEACWWNYDVGNSVIVKHKLWKCGNRERQVRKSIWKQTKNQGVVFTRQNAKQKGKDLEMLCNSNIKNVMCLRLESGWSKLIRIILVNSY